MLSTTTEATCLNGGSHEFRRIRVAACSDTSADEGIIFEDSAAQETCIKCGTDRRGIINMDFVVASEVNKRWDNIFRN